MTKEEMTALVLDHEGGEVNDPADPGGRTKYGIASRSHPDVDLDTLTKEGAAEIFLREYWEEWMAALPWQIALQAFDFGVNAGPTTAAKILQRALGVKDDGIPGPVTMATATRRAATPDALRRLRRDFAGEAILFYIDIVLRKPPQAKFLRNWIRRALDNLTRN